MKYEIEIPDGVIPEGYEPVAFRVPKEGEEAVTWCGEVFTSNGGGRMEPRLIIRKTSVYTNPRKACGK